MTTPIHEYPPVERKYVAVRRFKIIITPRLFKCLLDKLSLTEKEFALKYGEELIGNPSLFDKEVAEIIRNSIWRARHDE